MAAMVSVVSGGAVVNTRQLMDATSGKVERITAVSGARYVLTDVRGGKAAGDISVKRAGKHLVIEQDVAGAEPVTLVIEEFHGSDGQLVGVGEDGEHVEYLAVTEHGVVDAAAMSDGASSLLTMAVGQSAVMPGNFEFAESGSSVFSSVLAGVAAVAGGFALSNNKGAEAQSAPGSSAFVLKDEAASASLDSYPPVAAEPAAAEIQQEAGDASVQQTEACHGAAEVAGNAAGNARGDTGADIVSNENFNVVADSTAAPGIDAGDGNAASAAPAGVASFAIGDVPVIDKMMDNRGAITGVIENGGYTDDGYPVIMGKADPGVKVHVYRGKYLQGSVVADANGEWSFIPSTPFATGKHSITVIHEYPNTATSEESAPYVITVDRVAPPMPKIIGITDDEGRITGAISDQTITDDNRPTITGTAEAHATIVIYDKGKAIGSTTVGADGKWSFTPDTPLADGLHILSYSAVDRAGNASQQTDVTEFIVDTRPEKVNIYFADDDVGDKTGEVFSDGITDDAAPVLFGSATAGGVVKIYEGDVVIGQTIAGVDGIWYFTPEVALSDGMHTFHATVSLPAKGESDRSKPFVLDVDATPMERPSIDAVQDDTGDLPSVVEKGQHTADSTPILVGGALAGSTVQIYEGSKLLGSVLADDNGNWRFPVTTPLIEGEHSFTVKSESKTGNVSGMSEPYGIVVDTIAPGKPSIVLVDDDQGTVTGPVPNGGFTDDTRPAIQGKAEAGSIVIIKDHGVEIDRVVADANGDWRFLPEVALDEGAHGITVTATDKAGNASASSDAFDFTVDTRPLVKPTIDSVYDDVGPQTGNLNAGDISDDTQPLLRGKAAPNSVVVLKDNGVEIGRAPVDASGDWSFLVSVPLSQGVHNLVAMALKKSGEVGESSDSFDFRVSEEGPAGYENFNTLASTAQGVVLPSGAVLTGTYKFTVEGNGYPIGDGQVPMEDRGTGLHILDNATMAIKMPHPTKRVAFFHTAETSGHVVSYFNAAGVKIGQIVLVGASGTELREVSFSAPEGEQIASLQIASVDDAATGFLIENLSWGPRFPTAISIESASVNDAGVGIISGKVVGTTALEAGTVVQVSLDGGVTWHNAAFSRGVWTFIENSMPSGEWSAQVRMVDGAGRFLGLTDSTVVEARHALGAPVITDIPEAANIYTATLAQNGSEMTVSLTGTGAKVGDKVHIQWGTSTFDQVLTALNIAIGSVTLNVPAAVTYSTASYSYDFAVTAQIIGQDGALGAVSKPYDVVGTYTRALVSDTLQLAPTGNVYTGTGVTVTTTGTMAKTAATANSVAGLTLGDSLQANATFMLSKPADQISLRLSGADNALGARIRVFDVDGNLMHEQTVFGDATAQHLATFTWTKSGLADIGSFTVTAMSASVTLDSFSQYVVTHKADTRDPNLIDVLAETFYGSNGDDVVSISQYTQTYLAQATAAIHGGGGTDTLKLTGYNHVLDLTAAAGKITSIEVVDLTGSGNNTLTLNLSDVLRNGGVDLFHTGDEERVQMMVKGNAGDRVNLSDLLAGNVDHGDWVKKVSVNVEGVSFDSYQHSSLAAELLVQQGVTVVVTNSTVVGVETFTVGAAFGVVSDVLAGAGDALFSAQTQVSGGDSAVPAAIEVHQVQSFGSDLHDYRLEAY